MVNPVWQKDGRHLALTMVVSDACYKYLDSIAESEGILVNEVIVQVLEEYYEDSRLENLGR